MVCVENVLIRVTKRELIGGWRFVHLPVSSAACRLWRNRFEEFSLRFGRTACKVSRRPKSKYEASPSTRSCFSANLFPVETLLSKVDQISFLAGSLSFLVSRPSRPALVERNALLDAQPVVVAIVGTFDQPNLLTRRLSEDKFELTEEIIALVLEVNAELTEWDASVVGGVAVTLTLRSNDFLSSPPSLAPNSLNRSFFAQSSSQLLEAFNYH